MKKNFLYSLMTVFVMLFASCSQEEIVSTAGTGSNDGMVRLSVNLSNEDFYSRASQSLDVEGYVMRCICQAVNADGALIEGFNEIVPVTNGTASFEFEAPEGAANYLFWADYVEGNDIEASKSALYNATSLLEVKYNLNKNVKLFNNPAADAFCAVASTANIGGSITLKRPFSRIAIKTSDLEKLGLTELDIITPSINTTQGYSVLDKTVSAAVTCSLNTNETLSVATGDLAFYCYVFPVNNTVTKSTSIKFTSASDETGKTIQLTAAEMQELSSSPNNAIYLTPDEDQPVQPGDKTVKVDIVIDNEYTGEGGGEDPGTDPTPSTEMEVGSYVNAAGEVVATAAEAAGIVFAMGAIGDDTPANYPAALQGKTIKAYAVALKNVATSRQQINAEAIADGLTAAVPVNGTVNTDAFLTALSGSNFATTYSSWVTENATSGENVSSWYIPALPQLQQFMNMLFTIGETSATGSDAFRGMSEFALTANGPIFDRNPINTVYYASCTVNSEGNPSAIRINVTDGVVVNAQAAGMNVKGSAQSALCRPMFTIFE